MDIVPYGTCSTYVTTRSVYLELNKIIDDPEQKTHFLFVRGTQATSLTPEPKLINSTVGSLLCVSFVQALLKMGNETFLIQTYLDSIANLLPIMSFVNSSKTKMFTTKKTMTVPSSTSISHTEDYDLYRYPNHVTPFYRPIPFFIQSIMLLFSCGLTFLLQGKTNNLTVRRFTSIFISWLTFRFVAQEIFFSPSSIAQPWKHLKPCSLSKSTTVTVSPTIPSEKEITVKEPLGIHYIQYDNAKHQLETEGNGAAFDALHCNHGFGASSLSWLPALPSLTRAAKAPFGIAHDCLGFGLSQRAKSLTYYTSTGTASIGNHLLQQNLQKDPSSVVLLGHSMGCVATLLMALHFIPRETKKLVVLVAPALLPGKPTMKAATSKEPSRIQKVFQSVVNSQPSKLLQLVVNIFFSLLRTVILDIPLSLFIKRIVQ